jgi:hypothetical protein
MLGLFHITTSIKSGEKAGNFDVMVGRSVEKNELRGAFVLPSSVTSK